MKIDILTLFPNMFSPILDESILGRAKEKGMIDIKVHNIRDAASDKHHTVDDVPYGGGTGMVIKVDVVDKALEKIASMLSSSPFDKLRAGANASSERVGDLDSRPGTSDVPSGNDSKGPLRILLTPQGERLTSDIVQELAREDHLILICGHYEGFDERIREHLCDRQVSIGDYVLTGGELPALVLIDAVARFVPGVLAEGAPQEDSHSFEVDGQPALEYPHYTRPLEYKGWKVPDVLLSGNHAEIESWRKAHLRKMK